MCDRQCNNLQVQVLQLHEAKDIREAELMDKVRELELHEAKDIRKLHEAKDITRAGIETGIKGTDHNEQSCITNQVLTQQIFPPILENGFGLSLLHL
jgi:hypothetical protein